MARFLIPTMPREIAMTFSDLTLAAQRYMRGRAYSERSVTGYNVTWQQFLAFLNRPPHGNDVRYFTRETVTAFLDWLVDQGAHTNTVRLKFFHLVTLAKYATRHPSPEKPHVRVDPTHGVEPPQRVQPSRPFPTPGEMRAFMAVEITPRQRLVRDLLVDTGLRAAELCRANVGSVRQLQHGVVLAVAVKGRGRQQAEEAFPLSPHVVAQIRDQWAERTMPDPGEPLLIREDGQRYTGSTLHGLITGIARRAGVTRFPMGPHSIRHLVANMGKGRVDALTRSRLLGHSSPSTIRQYDHEMPGEYVAARAAMRADFLRYIEAPGEAMVAPAVPVAASASPEAVARLLDVLSRIPADRMAGILRLVEGLAGPVASAPEATAHGANQEAPHESAALPVERCDDA